jgi:CheY-like chemotaxis protein
MNLCANAGHAMQTSGGVLEIELTDIELGKRFNRQFQNLGPGSYVKLMVRDSGYGIPADILENVFDPFFSTKERGEGTGLGLAVVHGIVKSHGGVIQASSELGQGSVFEVYLPTIARGPEKIQHSVKPVLPKGKERILLVDDEPAIVDIGEQMLTKLGYQVITRTCSVEALDLFRAKPDNFDMVISDMTMPQMTGEELVQEIQAIRNSIPVILCTGFSNQIAAERAREIGINGFLMKPVVLADMAQQVRNILDESTPFRIGMAEAP